MSPHSALLLLVVLPFAALLTSCSSPSASQAGRDDFCAAKRQEVVQLNPGAQAFVSKDTSFAASGGEGRASIHLREGKLVVQKQKDGEVCDIVAGPATARLVGTTVLAEKRGSILRLITVEGRTRVNWGNRAGEYRMLNTGEMLMVDESRQTLPNPVLVNLGKLLSREELLAPNFLSSEKLALIEAAAAVQADRIASGRLQVVSPAFSTAGSPETLLNADVGKTARAVTTQVNVISSQTLSTAGGAVEGVTQAVTQTLGGLLNIRL
ncbi:MAG: hypothetical protein ACO1TE_27800 [Prosthecobacter sp.]